MNPHRVLNALVRLGLSKTDAKVYIYLASGGPQDVENIAEALRIQKDLLRKALENLKNKRIVTFASEQSTLFFALPFNKALDLLVKKQVKEMREIEMNKDKVLSKWNAILKDDANLR